MVCLIPSKSAWVNSTGISAERGERLCIYISFGVLYHPGTNVLWINANFSGIEHGLSHHKPLCLMPSNRAWALACGEYDWSEFLTTVQVTSRTHHKHLDCFSHCAEFCLEENWLAGTSKLNLTSALRWHKIMVDQNIRSHAQYPSVCLCSTHSTAHRGSRRNSNTDKYYLTKQTHKKGAESATN